MSGSSVDNDTLSPLSKNLGKGLELYFRNNLLLDNGEIAIGIYLR